MARRPALTCCTAWLPVRAPRALVYLPVLVLLGELLPQLLGAAAGQRVFFGDAAAEADDVGCLVVPGDTFPARVGGPLELQCGGLLLRASAGWAQMLQSSLSPWWAPAAGRSCVSAGPGRLFRSW